MSKSVTTNINLGVDLNEKLERVAHNIRHDKDWIIREALRRYIKQSESSDLAQEARRQSLLISKEENPDADIWEINGDCEGWTS